MLDITCPSYNSINNLYKKIKENNYSGQFNNDEFINDFLLLLEKVPSSLYPSYTSFINKYRTERIVEVQKKITTIEDNSSTTNSSYIGNITAFINKFQGKSMERNNLSDDVDLNFATIINNTYNYLHGRRESRANTIRERKLEVDYKTIDYFVILKDYFYDNENISNYEIYLKADLSLKYLETNMHNIERFYKFYSIMDSSILTINENDDTQVYKVLIADYNKNKAFYTQRYEDMNRLQNKYNNDKDRIKNIGDLEFEIKKLYEIYKEQQITSPQQRGGKTKIIISKKDILGKERCIYKKSGDRKEYVKYKGDLITVKDFKKLMKSKEIKHK